MDILTHCPFFAMVKGDSRQRLYDMARLVKLSAGGVVFRQGQTCPGIFVVGSGAVRVYKLAPTGKEHVLHVVGPGGTFAEVAVIGGFPCPAHAQAVETSTCALLPGDPLRKALREDHDLCLQLLQGMAVWVKHLVGLVESITLRDALGRVAHYMINQPIDADGKSRLRGQKRLLASHLNLTSETFSRVLRKLKDDGLVKSQGTALIVVNREALLALAEGDHTASTSRMLPRQARKVMTNVEF